MRINGEAFLLMNVGMDFLCLLLAACLARARFFPLRALLAAAAGALYALWTAATGGPVLRGIPALAITAWGMTAIAFGPSGIRWFPLTGASGLLLAGCADYFRSRGWNGPQTLLGCAGAAIALALLLPRGGVPREEAYTLCVDWNGQRVTIPAFRDSGNLLRDGITGLPVIVAPLGALRSLLPPEVRLSDLTTLPRGWRFLRIRTAAGSRTVMCFHPDQLILCQGKRQWKIQAAVAVAEFQERRALLPGNLWEAKEETLHAGC